LAAAWTALMGERASPLGRDQLAELMERFPDGR
jgi:hypothetical protein